MTLESLNHRNLHYISQSNPKEEVSKLCAFVECSRSFYGVLNPTNSSLYEIESLLFTSRRWILLTIKHLNPLNTPSGLKAWRCKKWWLRISRNSILNARCRHNKHLKLQSLGNVFIYESPVAFTPPMISQTVLEIAFRGTYVQIYSATGSARLNLGEALAEVGGKRMQRHLDMDTATGNQNVALFHSIME